MKTLKLSSLQSLAVIANPTKAGYEKWAAFLKSNGHTTETFSYLPDHLQLSLKMSFAKKP